MLSQMRNRSEQIRANLQRVREEIPDGVCLIVVTKTFPASDVEILYQLGERNFAENRVQELVTKRDQLRGSLGADARWHFQGRIQSNKIGLLNQYAEVIHSLDSNKHLSKLDQSRAILVQVNLDGEKVSSDGSRVGIAPDQTLDLARKAYEKFGERFRGVMGVSPHREDVTNDEKRAGFHLLQTLSQEVLTFAPSANWISAGMSDDYRIAIAEGATHIRLGSSILGERGPQP